MKIKSESTEFTNTCRGASVLLCVYATLAICIVVFFPAPKVIPFVAIAQSSDMPLDEAIDVDIVIDEVNYFSSVLRRGDDGLALYRQLPSRAAVEFFYINETGDRAVAMAILEQADKNDIPLSLAFALAYTESRYNIRAVNYNTNTSVDRGLFQLNSNSFPQLTEDDFFNAATSARYGMSHLRFCLNLAGNAVTALAMYNAGASRVRSNSTPQMTLNYIGKIVSYKQMLDKRFANDVISYYDTPFNMGAALVYQN